MRLPKSGLRMRAFARLNSRKICCAVPNLSDKTSRVGPRYCGRSGEWLHGTGWPYGVALRSHQHLVAFCQGQTKRMASSMVAGEKIISPTRSIDLL